MSVLKNKKEIDIFKEAGRRLATVLDDVITMVKSGVTEKELDDRARELIVAGGDVPAFLHYRPEGADRPYPATLCVSVNNNVVHGIPAGRALKEGDLVGLDIGLQHEGLIVDMCKTVPVGTITDEDQHLLEVTKGALKKGIEAARVGNRVGDIGHAIESFVKGTGFSIVHELGGHGVGHKLHEEPFIANFGTLGKGVKLVEGMSLALEPIVNQGTPEITCLPDGYTLQTEDKRKSAHFEHTILITKDGPEIITKV